MITYETVWLIEKAIGVKESVLITDWRVECSFSTNVHPVDLMIDIDPKAEQNIAPYLRGDLFYNKENKILYKLTQTKHYFASRELGNRNTEERRNEGKKCPF